MARATWLLTRARTQPVTDISRGARQILVGHADESDSSTQLADRAMKAYEQLASHLSRLLGDLGVEMLLARSVTIASAEFPWLRAMPQARPPRALVLRQAMEQQEAASIVDAFVAIMTTLVGLLKRLIGDGLVDRLLHEVWPTVFVDDVKDAP